MPNANSLVTLIKGDSTTIDNTEVLDGQILFDETRHKIFMDDNSTRDSYGGGGNEENIAYVESGTTASRGYPKGSYVIVNEQLYKTLVQINSGTTFVVDTNIEATSVGIELGRTVTQAEYDALPAAQKNKGIWYIKDSASTSSIDTALSTTSENPVQNKVITGEINQINNNLTAQNNMPFRFDYQDNHYGYIVESGGADTFFPFKSGGDAEFINTETSVINRTGGGGTNTTSEITIQDDGRYLVCVSASAGSQRSYMGNGSSVLYKNNTNILSKTGGLVRGSGDSDYSFCNYSTVIDCAVGDKIKVSFSYTTHQTYPSTGLVQLDIWKVG